MTTALGAERRGANVKDGVAHSVPRLEDVLGTLSNWTFTRDLSRTLSSE
jgi:hypothetical protein